MKPFLTLLLAFLSAATGYGQTIKALSYDTATGNVVYSGTNLLTFPSSLSAAGNVSTPAFRVADGRGIYSGTAAGIGAFLGVANNSAIVARFGTNRIWFTHPLDFGSATNAATATTRTNLGLGGGLATNISVLVSGGGTNTLQFFNGILTNVTSP